MSGNKDEKKSIIKPYYLIIVPILILIAIFVTAKIQTDNMYFSTDKELKDSIVGNKIKNPDRIVYKNEKNEYFEFKNDTKSYSQIKALLSNIIEEYDENGDTLTQEEIDEIHQKNFIEFDYKTASQNYIIQLSENNNQAVIKLSKNGGGNVVCKNIINKNKLKNTVDTLSRKQKATSLYYKEEISRNILPSLEYKYLSLFNNIEGGTAYQVKIQSMEEYEKFKEICYIAISEDITSKTFENNDIILTVSLNPKIEAKVSLGNIKYTYGKIENAGYGYTVHVLIVSKIVNTDCIYNKNNTEIENKVENEIIKNNYNEDVNNLDTTIFVVDYNKFKQEYDTSNSKITEKEASVIAELGFKQAIRICGEYDEKTQSVTEEQVLANNFFTAKYGDPTKQYNEKIDVYAFSREDEMGNGVKVFVDKKLGKIIGGEAFGD